jgi:hypothetical protein
MSPALSSLLGIGLADAGLVLQALGFAAGQGDLGPTYALPRRPRSAPRRPRGATGEASPFAALRRRIPA